MNATVNAFDANPIRRDDVVMGCLPLFHTFGQTVVDELAPSGSARRCVLLAALRRGEAAIELMHRRARDALLRRADDVRPAARGGAAAPTELPELRDCVSGGASLPVAVLERFEKAFGTTVFEGYGLSETSPTATVNQPWFGTRAGTVGHPIWGVEVEIADRDVDDRDRAAAGRRARRDRHPRPQRVRGLPRPTRRRPRQAIVDGWFRTGDLGTKDDDGFITIVDRKKDLIIRGGFNVYPREVEEVLARHPAVAQVAVIGVPDAEHGEEICAVVVPDRPGAAARAEPSSSPGRASSSAGTSTRGGSSSSTRCRSGPSHKVLKRELRTRYSG